ncbi:MAG: hypothetical protein AB7S38_11670 [Vulcanimicrobiota bacterium]
MGELRAEIARANQVSRRFVWKFWKAREIHTRESLEALDRIERAAGQESNQQVARAVAQTRTGNEADPTHRLEVLRASFEALEAGLGDGVCGLAGYALRLSQAAEATGPALVEANRQLQPGWESDFLGSLKGLPAEQALTELASEQSWTLTRAARVAEQYRGDQTIDRLRQLEPNQAFEAYDQLADAQWQDDLDAHLVHQLGQEKPYEPLGFAREFFASRQSSDQREKVAEWALGASQGAWQSFWQGARPASVEVLEKIYAGEAFGVETALAAVSGHLEQHPELLGTVRQVAVEGQRTDWVEAFDRLQSLSPPLQKAGVEHLLGKGRDGLERALIAAAAPGPALLGVAQSLLSTCPDSRLKSFLVGLGQLPFEGDQGRSLAQARGARILVEENPVDEARQMALLACRSCDATPAISEKFTILQQGLAQLHHDLPDGWGKQAAELVWQLCHLEAPENQLWLRTSAAHHGLRLLARGLPANEGELVTFGRELAQAQWMIPAWRQPVEGLVKKGLATSPDPLVQAKLADSGASLADLERILTSLPFQTRVDASGLEMEVNQSYIEVGGQEIAIQEAPRATELVLAPETRRSTAETTELKPDFEYTATERQQLVETRWNESYKSGLAIVYNPASGQFDSHEGYKDGVAGGYDPTRGETKFESSYKDGVGMVYHPETASFETRTSYKSGLAGLRNPVTGGVTFKESYKSGLAGAANPYSGEEKWEESYKSGVAGYWDPAREAFEFRESYKSGLATATNDPAAPTLTTSYTWSYDFE